MLGVTTNLTETTTCVLQVENKPERIANIIESLQAVQFAGKMSSRETAITKGKLQFASCQIRGRVVPQTENQNAIVFASIVPVIFRPDILIDQYLTTPDLGHLVAADIDTRMFWQDLIRSLLIKRRGVAAIRFERFLQTIADRNRNA